MTFFYANKEDNYMKYGYTTKQIKDYVKDYINRMEKVCKEVNKDYKYGYNEKFLINGLEDIYRECKEKGFNNFTVNFIDLIYHKYTHPDKGLRCGIEMEFMNSFYDNLKDGFIGDLVLIDQKDIDAYIEKIVNDYIGSIKLEINSLRFNGIEDVGLRGEIFALRDDGECRYFAYDMIGHFYDEFIEVNKDYLMECIKETLNESLKIYRNKEQIYDFYVNGRGRQMVVNSELYNLENPFEKYKKTFEKLESNDFSEFRKHEFRLLYIKENKVERDKENGRG